MLGRSRQNCRQLVLAHRRNSGRSVSFISCLFPGAARGEETNDLLRPTIQGRKGNDLANARGIGDGGPIGWRSTMSPSSAGRSRARPRRRCCCKRTRRCGCLSLKKARCSSGGWGSPPLRSARFFSTGCWDCRRILTSIITANRGCGSGSRTPKPKSSTIAARSAANTSCAFPRLWWTAPCSMRKSSSAPSPSVRNAAVRRS